VLSQAENELLCRVEGDAPMGRLMRRYWQPMLLAEELETRTELRQKIVNCDLVATRNAQGAYVVRDTERVYPSRVAGGIVWVYLGPPELEPPFPALDWTALPREQLCLIKFVQHANYLQALEGGVDTVHTWFLHRGDISDWKNRMSLTQDFAPKLEAEDTAYGFRYCSIRKPNTDPETKRYVRVTNVVFPVTVLVPRPMDDTLLPAVQMFVPMDDTRTLHFTIFFSPVGRTVDEKFIREDWLCVPGVNIDDTTFRLDTTEDNWWQQDRTAMKAGSWCGVAGIPKQDVACQESMGAIVDRRGEHLGTSDIGVIRLRRRMLENVRNSLAGEALIGVDPAIDFARIRSEQRIIGIEEPWQKVGAFAGEFAHV
jgi:phthalate 4,5-dioxygenase oxygenase subunit